MYPSVMITCESILDWPLYGSKKNTNISSKFNYVFGMPSRLRCESIECAYHISSIRPTWRKKKEEEVGYTEIITGI